jgi:N-hydroxyarylamine O-acetyltransferase
LLGRGVSLELPDIEAKLVKARRGGYCFEHNTLLAAVLERIGFAVTRLAARVRMGASKPRPRSHMLLAVDVAGSPWLADVGFGGAGLLYPIPLGPSEAAGAPLWSHRIQRDACAFVLQTRLPEGWLDLYAFTLEEQLPVDYVVANHFTSTYPHSPFVLSLVVQRSAAGQRWTLHNDELTAETPESASSLTIPADALVDTLATVFDLHFPAGTRFCYRPTADG